ncbi:MAG TPA: RNA methyltransferase [Acidimicrobiia bacterium]|nr:RNA methyltransferase [Acidimicrobiia bacterium]
MVPAGFGDRVEGLNAVRAAAAAGRVLELWIESHRLRGAADIAEKVEGGGGTVHVVESVAGRADTEAPQGVVARCRLLPLIPLDGVSSGPAPALMVLDHITDPHNLGAIARSVQAAGFTGLVVPARRAAPLSAAAFKAAAGALERLPVVMVNSIADALSRLQRIGIWSVGLDTRGEADLFGLALLTEPVAIVVGSEGAGLSPLVRQRLEVTAQIPLAGEVESLNVSVAAALAAFEVQRVRAPSTPARDVT